mgnify:FL=1
MLTGHFPDAGERAPEELLAAYLEIVGNVIEDRGRKAVITETGLSGNIVDVLASDVSSPAGTGTTVPDGIGELTLTDTASVLALSPEYPDIDTIVAEARDILLMGMTTAVMDVDAIAAQLGGDLDPKTIQQKVEGRHPITLEEYARIHQLLGANS